MLKSLLIGTLCMTSTQAQTDPMQYRIWQFQVDQPDYVEASLPLAVEQRINRVQLSHNLIHDIHELDDPARLATVRRLAQAAKKQGLAVDVWTHEFSKVPERFLINGKLDFDNAELWTWLDQRYDDAFERVPEIDGLVLTFAETDFQVHLDKIHTAESPTSRITRLINAMAEICRRHDKTLFVRTFVYNPDEKEFMREALREIAKSNQGRDDLIVMTKCVPHDWTPYYPYNPLLGETSGLPQIVEIDLGQEFTGKSIILHVEPDYIQSVLNHSRAKGVIGAVARVDRKGGLRALGTPNEANIAIFSHLLNDPSSDANELLLDLCARRYGAEAAPKVAEALTLTFEITNLTLFPLQQWFCNHSVAPSWRYASQRLLVRHNANWIPSPEQERLIELLRRPTQETVLLLGAQKQTALELADQSLKLLDEARPHMKPDDFTQLNIYLQRGRLAVDAYAAHERAYFTTLLALQSLEEGKSSENAVANARNAIEQLREQASAVENARLGYVLGFQHEARKFAQDAEEKLQAAGQ